MNRTPPCPQQLELQAGSTLHSDPSACCRVLCQRQRHEVAGDNVCQLWPQASSHSIPASALASRHPSAVEREGPGQRCWGPSSSGLVSQEREDPDMDPSCSRPKFPAAWSACRQACTHRYSSNPPNRGLLAASKPSFPPHKKVQPLSLVGIRGK